MRNFKRNRELIQGLTPMEFKDYKKARIRENMLLVFLCGIALGVCLMYSVFYVEQPRHFPQGTYTSHIN